MTEAVRRGWKGEDKGQENAGKGAKAEEYKKLAIKRWKGTDRQREGMADRKGRKRRE